jgi:hypothetical protein
LGLLFGDLFVAGLVTLAVSWLVWRYREPKLPREMRF